MSKLIAVWGTPDSGKTTFATKLARSIYEEYQSTVIVVYADNETTTLPVIFPNFKKEDMFSVGAALAKTDVTQEDVVKHEYDKGTQINGCLYLYNGGKSNGKRRIHDGQSATPILTYLNEKIEIPHGQRLYPA